MAILFEDGFETLPFTGLVHVPPWTAASATATVVAAPVNQGDYAGKFDRIAPEAAGAENASKLIGTTYTELYLRAYVRVNAVGVLNRGYIGIYDDWGNEIGLVGASAGRNVVLRYLSGGAMLEDTSASQFTLDFWHCLELYVKISDTVGEDRVWLDSVELLDVAKAGLDNRIARDLGIITVGLRWGSVGTRVYIDCVVCADAWIGCKPTFGGGLNPAQMAEVILGL